MQLRSIAADLAQGRYEVNPGLAREIQQSGCRTFPRCLGETRTRHEELRVGPHHGRTNAAWAGTEICHEGFTRPVSYLRRGSGTCAQTDQGKPRWRTVHCVQQVKKTKNKCASDCYRCVYIHTYICISIFYNFQLRIIGTWTCNFISKKSLTELQLLNHAFEYFVQASAWMINHIASIYSRYLKYIVWTIITQPMRWIYSNDRSWIMAWMINYVQHMVGTVI